jgi:hypothetical protein
MAAFSRIPTLEGNRVSYTADDLFKNYQETPQFAFTEFDKVYEVLVRHYYDSLPSTKLADLQGLSGTRCHQRQANRQEQRFFDLELRGGVREDLDQPQRQERLGTLPIPPLRGRKDGFPEYHLSDLGDR